MHALTFRHITFSTILRDNQIWLRYLQIGDALGYSRPHLLDRIYQKHEDEFSPSMTQLLRVPTQGGMQQARVFSLRGAHLLAMFARTPVAKEFRCWILDILDRETKGSALTLNENETFNLYGVLRLMQIHLSPHSIQPLEQALRCVQSPYAIRIFDLWHEMPIRMMPLENVMHRCKTLHDNRR